MQTLINRKRHAGLEIPSLVGPDNKIVDWTKVFLLPVACHDHRRLHVQRKLLSYFHSSITGHPESFYIIPFHNTRPGLPMLNKTSRR